jgi:hypothetical protein
VFGTLSIHEAAHQLDFAVQQRMFASRMPPNVERVRVPVVFFFMRPTPGHESTLTDRVTMSWTKWNDQSGTALDLLFPGWFRDGAHRGFDTCGFDRVREDIRAAGGGDWGAEDDVLLVPFERPVDPPGEGAFRWDPKPSHHRLEEVLERYPNVGDVAGYVDQMIDCVQGVVDAVDNERSNYGDRVVWEEFQAHFALDRRAYTLLEALKRRLAPQR